MEARKPVNVLIAQFFPKGALTEKFTFVGVDSEAHAWELLRDHVGETGEPFRVDQLQALYRCEFVVAETPVRMTAGEHSIEVLRVL